MRNPIRDYKKKSIPIIDSTKTTIWDTMMDPNWGGDPTGLGNSNGNTNHELQSWTPAEAEECAEKWGGHSRLGHLSMGNSG